MVDKPDTSNITQLSSKAMKEIEKLNYFDSKAVQTMFRTVLRNHYNLIRMIDNKASIILTINSIIISLLMGVMFMAPPDARAVIQFGSKLLLNFGMGSMVFALLAMLPHRYKKNKENNYSGTLYAGSFSKFSFTQFKTEMDRIMSSGNNTYNEMIQDLYALGKSISIKQRLIWVSVLLFLIGLVGAILHALSNGVFIEQVLLNN